MGWMDATGQTLEQVFGVGPYDPGAPYRNALQQNGQQLQGYGTQWAGNYNANQAGIDNTAGMLTSLAQGNNSVSMAQAKQNLAAGQQQQMSQAAAAAPANQAMAARTAMINSGNLAGTIAGQQAVAGLQERQQALNTLANLQTTQSGQNINGALGAYQNANYAQGTDLQNQPKTLWGAIAPGVGGAAAGIAAL